MSFMNPSIAPHGIEADDLLTYIEDGKPTPFNALVEIMKLGHYLSGPSEGMRSVGYWTDSRKETYVCKGVTTSKIALQATAHTIVKQLKSQLQLIILRGFDTSSVRQQINSFEFNDKLNSRVTGEWFMSRPENAIKVTPQDFVLYLMKNHANGLACSQNNGFEWDCNRIREWLIQCDEFMDLILFTMHVTSGQPSRASELASLRLRDSNLAFRSVNVWRNRITFLSYYHKSMNVTGKFKSIARFAPRTLNADILLYFYLVRPIQAYFYKIIGKADEGKVFLDSVFVKCGKKMTAEQVRTSIAKGFASYSDMRMDVSTYRHVAVAFMEVNVRPELIRNDLLDEQAGHSHTVANTVYSRSANDPSSLSRDQMEQFWSASHEWHYFLGLDDRRVPLNESYDTDDGLDFRPPLKLPPPAPQVIHHHTVQPSICFDLAEQKKQSSYRLVPAHAFATAKKVVQTFVADKNARFSSSEQGLALASISSLPPENRIVVLPTGGGKSLIYMAHYIANPGCDKVSLVVVPPAALLTESVVKCNLKNISSCKYSNELGNSVGHYNLVFVAVEQIRLKEFRNYVALHVAMKRLHMIFIDEAHLAMTSNSYRPDMLFVPTLVEFGAPLVLLSATIPRTMETELSIVFRVKFTTIRTSTNRENIEYCVHTTDDLMGATISTMLSVQNQNAQSKNRCIVYCMTCQEVDTLCQEFSEQSRSSISRYHAKMDSQDQALSIARWKSGRSIWMVATSSFGVGIDYSHVRLVLHFGPAYSMIDFAQETGRSGRDRQPSKSLVLTNKKYQELRSSSSNTHTAIRTSEVNQFLNNNSQCRRQQLQIVLDGSGLPCLADDANVLCDYCQRCGDDSTESTPVIFINDDIQNAGRAAQHRDAMSRIVQGDIREFLQAVTPSKCAVCWIRDATPHTHRSMCPWLRNACYKCQQFGHGSRNCQFAIRFQSGTCFMCGLPCIDLAGIGPMHPYSYVDCTSPARGFVIEAAWAAFHTRVVEGIPTDAMEFARWLSKQSETCLFSNLIFLFHKLIKLKALS